MPALTVRSDPQPGDIGAIVGMHGRLYAREYGFDVTFEAYVSVPLGEFVLRAAERERIWLAERSGRIVGSVAIVAEAPRVAQLRWFLIDPEARGEGLGTRLLTDALAFSRAAGYERIVLWTVSALTGAARLYEAAGFRRTEATPARRWGTDVVEEKYEMSLQ